MSKEDVFISEKKSKGEIGRDILISLCVSTVFVCINNLIHDKVMEKPVFGQLARESSGKNL